MHPLPSETAARLYDLLEQASFAKLAPTDAAFVRQHLSPEEYERLRALDAETRTRFQGAASSALPDPSLQARLQAALRQKHAVRYSVAWWRRPVPAYQLAVAAVLPLLFLFAVSRVQTTSTPTAPASAMRVVYQKIVDTLYLPAPAARAALLAAAPPSEKPVPMRRSRSGAALRPVAPAVPQAAPAAPQEAVPMLALQPFTPSAPSNTGFSGRSLSDDSALARFIVRVN